MGRMGKNRFESRLIKLGSNPELHHGSLSDPIYKTSTIIFENYKNYLKAKKNKFNLPYYGRFGNYSVKRFEQIICKLYQSEASIITSSGLSAITFSLLSFLSQGDEILITENCYEPVYNFCNRELKKFGIKTRFFKNNNSKLLEKLCNKKTRLIYLESPGSLNYEVEDLEKIVEISKRKKIITVMDNTWATFLGINPLKWGIDIVIESCTKYISGHSDNFCGVIACSKLNFNKIKQTAVRFGDFVSSESCYNSIRGLKTLSIRLDKHQENAYKIFEYLNSKSCVKKILFLPDKNNINHELWKKYFKNGNGLITIAIEKKNKIEKFLDSLKLFKIGFSWGGFESLILPLNKLKPSIKNYKNSMFWFRIHVGLESTNDLIIDLENGFRNYEKK